MTNKLFSSRWVADALEKLDTFLSFQVFKLSEFLQKLEFGLRHILRLLHTVKFLIKSILLLWRLGFRLLETGFWNLLQLLWKSSSWPSTLVREQGASLTFYDVVRPSRLVQILTSVGLRILESLVELQIMLLVIKPLRLRASHNTNSLRIKIKLRGLNLKLGFCG